MRRTALLVPVFLLLAAIMPSHAAVMQVQGSAYGYVDTFGDYRDFVYVEIGPGDPAPIGATPSVVTPVGGLGWMHLHRTAWAGPEGDIDATVVFTHVSVSAVNQTEVIYDARGIGSDGRCYGVSLAAFSRSIGFPYVGLATGSSSSVDDAQGPCVAKDRTLLDGVGFTYTTVA